MPLATFYPKETEEQRDARRMYEKRWDKLLRKTKAMVDEKFKPEYVLNVIQNVYKIGLDYVKLESPEVYSFVQPLLSTSSTPAQVSKSVEVKTESPVVEVENDDPVGNAPAPPEDEQD